MKCVARAHVATGMRIKSLLAASLIALSSTTAMAHPYMHHASQQQRYSANPYGYQVAPASYGYRVATYAYGQNPYEANIARDQWRTFADAVALDGDYGLASSPSFSGAVRMPMRGERLAALELQATRGGSFVSTIIVDLMDGRQIQVSPQRALDVVHAPNLRVDFGDAARCGIRSITIHGQNVSGGLFRVIGA